MFLYMQNWFWLAFLGLLIVVAVVFYSKQRKVESIDYNDVDNEEEVSSNAR